jgi:hypothetical protein
MVDPILSMYVEFLEAEGKERKNPEKWVKVEEGWVD